MNNYKTGKVNNYIQTPNEVLTENQINMSKAVSQANNNPFAVGLDILGGMIMSNSGKIAGSLSNDTMATGGNASGVKELEGREIVEIPGQGATELKGPSHEQGGIDMFLPPGSEVFSARLTGPDGKTMADRKKNREKIISKYQKLLDKNPTDAVLKKTFDKIASSNEKEEKEDLAKMEMARMAYQLGASMMTGGKIKYATGGKIDPRFKDFSINPTDNASLGNEFSVNDSITTDGLDPQGNGAVDFLNNLFADDGSGITFGDGVGLVGDLMSTFAPIKNTRNARATDTPNINAFENFGVDALNTIEDTKDYVAGQRDNNLQDLELSKNAAIKRGRNSARGVNTQRALDLSTEMGANDARNDIYNQFAQMMQSILSQQAQLENQQDSVVMQGEQQRDLADRQDKDNYYSNLAKDISTMGTGIQKTGKDINAIKQREVIQNMLNEMFTNFDINTKTGKISGKSN